MYVDDFIYFSKSDDVEEWFEQQLESQVKVDFMGAVSWFLGCSYEWHYLKDGRLTCHISQQAYVEQLLDRFDMTECVPSNRLYKQGFPIDRIPQTGPPSDKKEEFIKEYQSLMGGLTCLAGNQHAPIHKRCDQTAQSVQLQTLSRTYGLR